MSDDLIIQSPSQTVGPYYKIGMVYGNVHIMINDDVQGQRIQFAGQLLDGDRNPIPDGCLEIWQADTNGYFNHPADPNQDKADKALRGWARIQCDDEGRFAVKTIKPGPVQNTDGTMLAPHFAVHVFGRGMLIHARTRFFFSDEAEANASDPVYNAIPKDRRDTVVMKLSDDTNDIPTYHLDIKFQGDDETAFFDVYA